MPFEFKYIDLPFASSSDNAIGYHTALLSTTLFLSTSERPTTFVVEYNNYDAKNNGAILSPAEADIGYMDNHSTKHETTQTRRLEDLSAPPFRGRGVGSSQFMATARDDRSTAATVPMTANGKMKAMDELTHVRDSELLSTHDVRKHIVYSQANANHDEEEEGRADFSGTMNRRLYYGYRLPG